MNEHQLDMLSVLLGNPDSIIHTPSFSSQKDFIIRQLMNHRHFSRLDISLWNNRTYSERYERFDCEYIRHKEFQK